MEELLKRIRSRSRESYAETYRDRVLNVRIWIQEHGELSLVLGVFLGIGFVLCFKAVITAAVMAVLAAQVIYFIAEPEAKRPISVDLATMDTPKPTKAAPQEDKSKPAATAVVKADDNPKEKPIEKSEQPLAKKDGPAKKPAKKSSAAKKTSAKSSTKKAAKKKSASKKKSSTKKSSAKQKKASAKKSTKKKS